MESAQQQTRQAICLIPKCCVISAAQTDASPQRSHSPFPPCHLPSLSCSHNCQVPRLLLSTSPGVQRRPLTCFPCRHGWHQHQNKTKQRKTLANFTIHCGNFKGRQRNCRMCCRWAVFTSGVMERKRLRLAGHQHIEKHCVVGIFLHLNI